MCASQLNALLSGHLLKRATDMVPAPALDQLSQADFHLRYYDLCERFPLRPSRRLRPSEKRVGAILDRLGRKPRSQEGARAFEFGRVLDGVATLQAVALQSGEIVEFWFSAKLPSGEVGDTLAILARSIVLHAGLREPNPPYPRPTYTSLDELERVLKEGLALADEACAAMVASRPTKA